MMDFLYFFIFKKMLYKKVGIKKYYKNGAIQKLLIRLSTYINIYVGKRIAF